MENNNYRIILLMYRPYKNHKLLSQIAFYYKTKTITV